MALAHQAELRSRLPMEKPDDEYRNLVAVAVYQAIADASRDQYGVAVIRTGAAFDALMMVAALLVSKGPQVDTPQKLRQFSLDAAEKLRASIKEAQSSSSFDSTLSVAPDPWGKKT